MYMDETHMSLHKVGKNIIVPHEGQISSYIESVPQPHVNFIEEDIGVYSIFLEEETYVTPPIDHNDHIWNMNFDGACSSEGKCAGIVLYSPLGKIHNFSYRLEFSFTNNVV
jgi:hypothetical protein